MAGKLVASAGSLAAPSAIRLANSASRSQYWAGRNAMRSRSRSTTSRIATDWTRPADSCGMTFFHSTGDTSYPYSRSSTRRVWYASTMPWSTSRGLATARAMASGVISWNTIRRAGTRGLSSSIRCQAIASPSRSSSVASKSSSASLSSDLSLDTCCFLSELTTYSGAKSWSTSTPSRAQGSPRSLTGISAARSGMSRMWPMLDSTTYPSPR